MLLFLFKQNTAYEMRIRDWSSDVCSSDLGWNGAGKTSLLNTVIWCLTGEILRPQRQPESGQEEFDGHYVRSVDGKDETTNHALSPVTPLPNPTYYMPPVGKPVSSEEHTSELQSLMRI